MTETPTPADAAVVLWHELGKPEWKLHEIASALRAQYVAGLEAAALEADDFDPDGGIGDLLASRIRELAEQAKREG